MKRLLLFIITAVVFSTLFTSVSNAEPRRVLLEFVTGTWCQWCPCGDDVAEQVLTQWPGTVVLAYHGAGSDPWQNFNGSAIRSMLGFAAYPTGIIDRRNHPGNPSIGFPYIDYPQWYNLVLARYTNSPASTVNLIITSKSYNTGTRELSANVDATALQVLEGQYKISFVLTESNVVYPQTGNGTCPGSSTYIHKWIVRSMINGPTGDNINTGTWNANQTISKSFTTTLDAAWIPANCDFAVIALKDSSAVYYGEIQQSLKQSVINPVGVITTGGIPASFSLSQNYPNPFNPTTNIKFTVPKDGIVSLKVFDINGKEVATYADGFFKAGYYNTDFDGTSLSSGVYFYRLTAGEFTDTKKMILVK